MNARERVGEIYDAERGNIYSYLVYLGLPNARAQELAQDAFVKLYVKMSKGETVENPRAWLYRVAHRLAIRSSEREPRFEELETNLEPPSTSPDPERTAMDSERRAALASAVRDLSPRQRNCLYLRVQGLRYREIAAVVGISTSAVGEFLRRAAKRLKEALDG